MQLKYSHYQPPLYSLDQSLFRLDSKYDRQSIPKQKIARSIYVPTADSISIVHAYKNFDKSFNNEQKSKIVRSKTYASVGKKQPKLKQQQKKQEISYYKVLYQNLRSQNQRLRYKIDRKKNPKLWKNKVNKSKIDQSQTQHLVYQIRNIEKKFQQDKKDPLKYQGFYKKFIQQFKKIGYKTPKSIQQAWKEWQCVRKRMLQLDN